MGNLSIRLKLTVLMGMFVIVLVGVLLVTSVMSINKVGAFATTELTAVQQTQAEEMLMTAALRAKTEVQNYLGSSAAVVDSFAEILSRTSTHNSGQPFSREEVRSLTEYLVKSAPNMNALYAQFEINGYDQLDAQNVGNSRHSSDLGTLDTYWVNEDGEYTFYDSLHEEKYLDGMDEHGNREAEWYLCSRDTSGFCILDPYLYEVSDENTILMTSYVAPVLKGNQFLGVVGADINIPAIQTALTDISSTLMAGAGAISVTSQKDLIVGTTEMPDVAGSSISESALDISPNIEGLQKSDEYWSYSIPFEIGKAPQQWHVIVRVPTKSLFASTYELKTEMSAKISETVITVLTISLVLVLVGLGVLYLVVNSIASPLAEIARKMNYLSTNDGDLTQRLDSQKHKELNELINGFNRFSEKLRDMIVSLMQQRDVVSKSNEEFTHATITANNATQRQAEQVDSVVTAVTEMASTANEVSSLATDNSAAAKEISGFLGETTQLVEKNRDMVEALATRLISAGDQVGKVSESSEAIYGILHTIRSIAEQTNLLALNAAIEAARAGEQGRGFAVVADEVRNLAARTQQSTEEVDELIKRLQSDVNEAVTLIEGSRQDVENTAASTVESTEKITEVNRRLSTISDNTIQVASVAKEQSNVAEQVNQSLVSIGDSSNDLADIVSSLKTNNEASASAVRELTAILSLLKV